MARGSTQAQTAATSAQNLSNTYAGNAQTGFETLMPELTSEAMNPQGFTQPDLARMTTGAEQTAGGSTAGATGQGALLAARTRNPGTANAAIATSARNAAEALSKANLGVEEKNAALKEEQRQAGLSGLENLTGLNTGASVNALGQVASNVNANTEAENASWDWAKFVMDPMLEAGGKVGAAALMQGGGGGGGGG